jgi:hypothetical protein
VPLSEHEQRLLEQIEQALYAEDPKFASIYRTTNLRRHYRARMIRAGALFVAGIGLLLTGVIIKHPEIGVAGFLAMLAGAWLAILAWQRLTGKRTPTVQAAAAANAPKARANRAGKRWRSPIARLEERWERRQERGGR